MLGEQDARLHGSNPRQLPRWLLLLLLGCDGIGVESTQLRRVRAPHGSGLTGSFRRLVIKNETVVLVQRIGELPLRSIDSGETWQPMQSLAAITPFISQLSYSWSGQTLVMFGRGGVQSAAHPHASYVWKSLDDGDTWTDETADIVTQGAGITGWYEKDLYLSSAGQVRHQGTRRAATSSACACGRPSTHCARWLCARLGRASW
jgi:hypothetical protein